MYSTNIYTLEFDQRGKPFCKRNTPLRLSSSHLSISEPKLSSLHPLKKRGHKREIKARVPDDLYQEITKVNKERQKKEEEKARKRQRDKYYQLKYGEKYKEFHKKTNNQEQESTTENYNIQIKGIEKSKWVINKHL